MTRTVLVVEDDRDVQGLLELVLSTAGFRVLTAGDGLEGLLKLQVARPDVVLLDLQMPDLGGLRVLDELAESGGGIPVIVVSGSSDGTAEARRRLGSPNVFGKPFDVDHLVARVRAVTAVRHDEGDAT